MDTGSDLLAEIALSLMERINRIQKLIGQLIFQHITIYTRFQRAVDILQVIVDGKR